MKPGFFCSRCGKDRRYQGVQMIYTILNGNMVCGYCWSDLQYKKQEDEF